MSSYCSPSNVSSYCSPRNVSSDCPTNLRMLCYLSSDNGSNRISYNTSNMSSDGNDDQCAIITTH